MGLSIHSQVISELILNKKFFYIGGGRGEATLDDGTELDILTSMNGGYCFRLKGDSSNSITVDVEDIMNLIEYSEEFTKLLKNLKKESNETK